MLGLRIFLCLACAVAATNSCIIGDKKEDQQVHVFHIGAPNNAPGNEPDIIELHIPDGRKKREASKVADYPPISCARDDDCPHGVGCALETSKCRMYRLNPNAGRAV